MIHSTPTPLQALNPPLQIKPKSRSSSRPPLSPPCPTSTRKTSSKASHRQCYTCSIERPPLASHCSVCDNCVLEFDHHCFMINNCVGRRNLKYFMLFNNCGALASSYVAAFTVVYIVLAILEGDDHNDALQRFLHMIPVIVAGFLLLIWSICCCRPSHPLFFLPFTVGVILILGGFAYLVNWRGFERTAIPVINLFLGPSMFLWTFGFSAKYLVLACINKTEKEVVSVHRSVRTTKRMSSGQKCRNCLGLYFRKVPRSSINSGCV